MRRSAFTLVELSIVIVIIGLIVAGVLAGQSLVKQAQLRGVASDIRKFEVALNTFKLQYNALPGDMPNASAYWGGAGDGNGNGVLIEDASDMTEALWFWQHLALAGIIQGTYISDDQGSPNSVPGINVPKGTISGSGYYTHAMSGNNVFVTTGNLITLTVQNTSNFFAGVLTPVDAASIDQKMDDGMPAMGMVFADTAACGGSGCSPVCVSQPRTFTGDPLTVTYTFTTTQKYCRMWFWLNKPR